MIYICTATTVRVPCGHTPHIRQRERDRQFLVFSLSVYNGGHWPRGQRTRYKHRRRARTSRPRHRHDDGGHHHRHRNRLPQRFTVLRMHARSFDCNDHQVTIALAPTSCHPPPLPQLCVLILIFMHELRSSKSENIYIRAILHTIHIHARRALFV